MINPDQALQHIKNKKKEFIKEFADIEIYPSYKEPFTMFMAGSPGAGKTETSKAWIKDYKKEFDIEIVRIDADAIREFFPQFNKSNTDAVKRACMKGVELLHDYAIKKDQNILLDGTLSKYEIARKNIQRSLKHKRDVEIMYIYQEPQKAWEFTKIREAMEGRSIPKDFFIDSFFGAKDTVDKIKEEFGKKITLFLVIKDDYNNVKKYKIKVDKLDNYLKIEYNRQSLEKLLK